MRTLLKTSLLVVLAISMSACGFHLRGQLPISDAANVIFVEGKSSDFKTDIEKRLVNNGASLVDSAASAKMTLQVSEPELTRTTKTIDERGKVNSYALAYSVTYALVDANDKLVKQQVLTESRNYTFDSSRILQQEREERDLIDDMNDELVLKLVRQLSKI